MLRVKLVYILLGAVVGANLVCYFFFRDSMTFVLFGSLIGINILGYFFCMGEYSEIDRRRGRFLFPDNVYLLIALFGGLLGVWKGMRDFHLFRESKLRDLINLMVFLIFSVAFLIGRIMDSRQP